VSYQGVRAWVTGASDGIGAALAAELAARGASVAISARRAERLDQLAAGNPRLVPVPLDVSDREAVLAAEATVRERLGGLDLAVFNAGTWQQVDVLAWDSQLVRRHVDTNLMGLVYGIEAVLPAMRRAGRGRIVNVSSLAGRVCSQGGGVYHMTKFAVEALADALRPEVKPFGIDVINVLPGPFVSSYAGKVVDGIPDTGPDSPYVAFKRNLGQWMRDFLQPDHFGTMSCETVARAVFKAGSARRPRTRYNVGFIAHLGPIGRALTPDRVVDAHMARQIPIR